jgi:hypothetical protein
MSRWFRFYDDAVNDPKVQRLPGERFKAWINLLCLASKNDGVLPALADISFSLRMSEEKVSTLLDEFCAAGLIDPVEVDDAPMSYAPHNWNERQYKSDVADPTAASRQKAYRQRNKDRNATVTVTPTRAETDSETEQTLPTVAKRARRKPDVPLPDDWKPSLKAFQIAEQFGQNVQIVEGIFRDYLASSGKLYADYDAAFHNFIRNQNSFNRGGNNGVRPSENRGSIVNAADRAIANLEREIASDHEGGSGIVLSLPAQRLR